MAMSLTPTWFDAVRASPRFAAVARARWVWIRP
jgi:hypothetical protein